jgi:VCBS repeat-containing protein
VDVLANDSDPEGNLDAGSVSVTVGATNGTTSVDPVTGAVTYTPNAGYVGGDSFVYQVCDGESSPLCDTATVLVTVTASSVTLTFLPFDDAYVDSKKPTSNYGSESLLDAQAGGKEFDSYLKFTVTGVTGGVVSAKLRLWVLKESPDGGSIYSVLNDYSDGSGPWNESGLVWNNAPLIGGAPLATAGAVTNGTWVEFDVTTAVSVDGAHSFGLSSDISNAVRYSSKEGVNPPELLITVEGSGFSPPVANDDVYSTAEDTQLSVSLPGVLGNDTDADGDPLTAALETTTSSGTLVLNVDGSFTYDPDADFNGTDAFTYRANDGLVDSNLATVTITVNAVNDPPMAVDDGAMTSEGTPVVVDVLANDSDPEGNLDPTSVSVTVAATNGTTSVDPVTGAVTYTPNASYVGGDSFVYQVCDVEATPLCDTATVTMTVTVANNPPVANDDAYSTAEDTQLSVSLPGVLGNDTDADGDPLTAVLETTTSSGTLVLNVDGSFTYDPDADFNGTDTFTYRANDGLVDSNLATVTITVNAVNDPPLAVDDGAITSEGTPVVVDVLANDSDPEGNLDPTSVTVTVAATNGATSVDPVTGAVTYTPNASYVGGDSFVYQVCDGETVPLCDTATVTMTVTVPTTTLTFLPTDDAYVDSKKPTANYGSESLLQTQAGGKEFDSYLKFAISGIGTVVEAKLRLWVMKDSPDGGSVYSVSNDYSSGGGPWDEAGLVWNNAPVISGAPLASAGGVVTGTWVELDVTVAIGADGAYSFGLSSEISNGVRYSSREGGSPPELVITYQ